MTEATDKPSDCRHIATQAELDALLQIPGVCIHVLGNAEEPVKAWDAERQAKAEAERQPPAIAEP